MRHMIILCLMMVVLFSSSALAETLSRPDELEFPPLEFKVSYPEIFHLNNGISVYFKEDHELPLLDVALLVAAGKASVPAEKSGLGELLAATLRSGGAGDLSAEQLDKQLEALAANLSVHVDSYTTRFDLSLLSEEMAAGMALFAKVVRSPRFDSQRLEIARQQLLEQIRRRSDHPGKLAQQQLMSTLYAGHPLGVFAGQTSVQSVDQADLRHFYQQYFSPRNCRIALSGAVSKKQARQLLERAFGDWQGDGRVASVAPLVAPVGGGVQMIQRPLPQMTVLLGEIGIEKSNPDLYAVQVMNYILGGGGFNSRLMREIRSNRGLAYSVYSYFSVGRRLLGSFVAGCETKSSSVPEVIALLRDIMQQLRQSPVSAEELQLAKDSLINSFIFAFENSHAIAVRSMEQDFYGYPDGYLENYRQRLSEVTVADVQRVAQHYLHPQQQVLVLVGDEQQLPQPLERLGAPVVRVAVESLL